MVPYSRPAFLALAIALCAALPPPAAARPADGAALATSADDRSQHEGAGALLRLQVLLDRARFSPGEIDALAGSNQQRALRGFQQARGLPVTGHADAATWQALEQDTAPVLVDYTLTAADIEGPYARLPDDIMEQSKLDKLGYASLPEALGERFHASPALLGQLNPQIAQARPGTVLKVPAVATDPLPKAARLVVDRSDSVLRLLDGEGRVLAQYPASSGSEHDPLPLGEWNIVAVAPDPTFHYNPDLFWDADPSHGKAKLAPGPNNPVGTVWIDLSKPHYGIHGTPEPSGVGKRQSHGCIRLTNWDVAAVAAAIDTRTPVTLQE
ncbi:L,D-transpeptidase family protein [Pseudoxanthomonas daejeonensis]|uniref:Murein L,D-transpeptidase n=1 Tax=Pseudoxanthomonas daejeonensis TaxID=266062 RepID=A0ABQ6Z4B5_9GAMM|nr:L,D-transpeptidase [Pseudoxanthomonas daejeonensis]KAF1692585.1 murein L,D-transpeptidase [Pseudoxanthomonas daejeonensis]